MTGFERGLRNANEMSYKEENNGNRNQQKKQPEFNRLKSSAPWFPISLQQDWTQNNLFLMIYSSYDDADRIQQCNGPIYCDQSVSKQDHSYVLRRISSSQSFLIKIHFLCNIYKQAPSVYNPSQIYRLIFIKKQKIWNFWHNYVDRPKTYEHRERGLSEEESVTAFHSDSCHLS